MVEPDLVERIRRGKRFRSVGWLGVIGSLAIYAASRLIPFAGGTLGAILGVVLVASVALIAWTRLWFKESREPFQYTYSIGDFAPVPDATRSRPVQEELALLAPDLKAKLSERVKRLSLLDDEEVPEAEPNEATASHVHISGWHTLRHTGQDWELEVVPEVRLGGRGAPARLASIVRLRLDAATADGPLAQRTVPPRLRREGYDMLFERVYWSVASQIYAQIQRGVEEKVRLLPWGSLRASAYVHEAEDYAGSNTLDAYAAAQQLYRKALAIYDVRYREPAAGFMRRTGYALMRQLSHARGSLRRLRARVWRRSGRRDVMTARAELGLARMLVAEWQLGQLCGVVRREIYEATALADSAIARLDGVPVDVGGQRATMFSAHVVRATIRRQLQDLQGAEQALSEARRLLPARTRDDPEYLYAAGLIEPDRQLSLRLFDQATTLAAATERALFMRAEQYDVLWRRHEPREPGLADAVDDCYQDVIALNPGNLSAWSRRGYLCWLLAEDDDPERDRWRERALSALRAGRQYKEVRREASVAELDWNLARIAAEDGDFVAAYRHYIDAVSARLGDPRIDFEGEFYVTPTKALTRRFWRYRRRVLEMADRVPSDTPNIARMVKSVKAFVLNDCGLACQAHHARSGDEKSLRRARECFERAIDENPGFVLPAHNLANLRRQTCQMPGVGSQEELSLLRDAVELLDRVLQREPHWAPAQLLMVELQIELARVTGELHAAIPGNAEGAVEGSGLEAAQAEMAARELLDQKAGAQEEALARLRALLPHRALRDADGASLIDLAGTHVDALVTDRSVTWTKDFDAFHVAGLALWGSLLTDTAPVAGNRLCQRLRSMYSRGDLRLLEAQWRAAGAVVAENGDAEARQTVDECTDRFRHMVRAALRQDPIDLQALEATRSLSLEERRAALAHAFERGPSPTAMIRIGEARRELGDTEAAIETFQAAIRGGQAATVPIASLRLAELLEETSRTAKAIDAYRQAMGARDAEVAATGAAGAARLLRGVEHAGEAAALCAEAATNPRTAAKLADKLGGEGMRDEAMAVYRRALEQQAIEPELRTELQAGLAAGLLDESEGRNPEAEALLLSLAEAGPPVSWQAKLLLFLMLKDDEPERADGLAWEVIDGDDPILAPHAIYFLGHELEERGEADVAMGLYEEKLADHDLRPKLAELLQGRGIDPDELS